jgi:hypothetical protein
MYCIAVTLQVTDMVQSYELNLHPMPHSVTVSSKRYTMGFPVCCGSLKDVFAASSSFVHLYTLCSKEKEKTPAVVTNNTTQAGKCAVVPVHWQA